MATKLRLYQAVEIPVASGTTLTRFFFQDQPQLRNAYINAIQVYTDTAITKTPLTGSTPVSLADLKKSFLTLYSGDLQVIYQVPLLALNNIANGTDSYVFELPEIDGIVISWVKSYVSLPTAPTGATAYSFGIYYTLPQ
jgi:hypothetical protein